MPNYIHCGYSVNAYSARWRRLGTAGPPGDALSWNDRASYLRIEMIAFTRPVPDSIADCELTHLERQPIDVANAGRQHAEYEQVLRSLGCDVRQLPGLGD